jgi:hypothetical protein
MSTKNKERRTNEEDGIITDGIIQYLTAFKLCDPKKVTACSKKLEKSALVISETQEKRIFIKQAFFDTINEATAKSIQSAIQEFTKKAELPENLFRVSVASLPTEGSDDPHKLYLKLPDKTGAKEYLEQMIDDMNSHPQYVPHNYLSRKDMLLQPISVSLEGIETNVFVVLSVFSNGLAILKLEYSISNISIKSFSANNFTMYFDKYDSPRCFFDRNLTDFGYCTQDFFANDTFLQSEILRVIHEIVGERIIVGADYRLLILSNYSSKPEAIDNASYRFTKDIMYLIGSPLYEYNEPSKKRIEEVVSKSHHEITKYAHYYASTARKAVIARIGDEEASLRAEFGDDFADYKKDMNHIYFQGVIPAIEVVLLKYFIKCEIADKCSNITGKSLKELLIIKKEVHDSLLFEINSFKFTYDTMAKLTEFIDNMNTFMLSNEQIDKIIASFNDLVAAHKSINNEQKTALFSWLGMIISLLLSFTGVNEIIRLINSYYSFLNLFGADLFPVVILSWLILVGIVGISFLAFRMKKK